MKLRVGGTYMAQDGTVFFCYKKFVNGPGLQNGFLMQYQKTGLSAGGYWFSDGAFERFDHPRNLVKEILP